MEEQQVKPSDLPPTTSDNQDSAATPPVTTTVDPVRPAASADSSSQVAAADPAAVSAPTAAPAKDAAGREAPASMFSTSGLSSWAKNLKIPQPSSGQESPTGKNTFSRLTSGLGLHLSPKAAQQDEIAEGSVSPTTGQPGVFGSLTKGIVDSSKNDVKAVQVKARHMVSQNKRRYQEGGFDLDEKLGEDAAHQRHLVPVSMNTAGTRGRDPTDDPSSQYFVDDAHPYAAAAATALTSHRTKSKWSNLSSVPIPSPLPASAATAVLLRLRRRPHTALRFHAFALRRLLPSYSPPPLVFSASAAHVATASRLRDAALAVLASASRHYSPAEIFNALAATYRRFASAPFVFDLLLLAYLRSRRDALAAASVARRILAAGARPLPSTAAALLRSLPSAAAALDMYHQIYTHSSPQRNHLLLPIVHTFNSLLLAFYREGKCDKFKIVLQEMGKYSCKHNVYTYNILMAGYCDCKDVEKARGLWDEMIHEGIQPDVTAYNTMIGGYCRVGEVGMAEEMFKDMEMGGIDPSATTFEWLVRGHCMAGDAEVAMLVRADMRRRGFGLAPEVVEELLDGLCQNGRVEDGLGVLRVELRREEFVPTQRSYEVLIKGFCAEGEVEVAIRLQAEMAGKGFNASSEMYHAFIHAYEKSEDYEMVEKLRKEMAVMCT